MILNPAIFRAYDIRGESFKDFDEDGFFSTAAGFGKYIIDNFKIKNPHIFVSGDGRSSQPQLWPAVVAGLQSVGCNVTWGDTIPTPLNYFAFHEGDFDGAIQISASHNPPQYNGMKFRSPRDFTCGEELQKIRKLAECIECRKDVSFQDSAQKSEKKDFLPAYQKKLQSIIPKQHSKKIIVDAGNAVPGMFYPDLLESFGHKVQRLFCDLDPTFPNHQPDPERKENLIHLIQAMKESSADFGFAYDGDGDRLGVVLSDGTILSGDKIIYCLASDFLQRHPGAKIAVDVMISQTLIEKLRSKGAEVVMSRTGRAYIIETAEKAGALLGGEMSGHFVFGEDFYQHDDGMLASLRFLQAIENNPDLITEVTQGWPVMKEISDVITVPDTEKFSIMEKIAKDIQQKFSDINTLDGIRIDLGQSEWVIIRPSNTTPLIRIRMEIQDEKKMAEMKDYFMNILQKHV